MLLLAAVMWGGAYGMQTRMSYYIGPFTTIFLKGFSGYFILLYCLFKHKKFNKKTVYAGMLVGGCNCAGLVLQQIGLATSSVSKVSFISGLYIIFVPILRMLAGRIPKKRVWLAIAVACTGTYLMCITDSFTFELGDISTLISTIFFALQIIFIAVYSKDVDPVAFCGVQQTFTSLICGILMLVFENPQSSALSNIVLETAYVVYCSGLIAQIIQNKYQKLVDTNVASLIMSLESVFGAISGVIILNQTMSLREMIGGALIFAAVLIAESDGLLKWKKRTE